MFFWTIERAHETNRRVEYIQAARRVLELYTLELLNAETGQRGYLLTHQDIYLTPYQQALANDKEMGAQVKELLAPESAQPKFQELSALFDVKMAELSETVQLAQGGNVKAAMAIVLEGRGRRNMLAFQNLELQIFNTETASLMSCLAISEVENRDVFAVAGLGSILIIALIIGAAARAVAQIDGSLGSLVAAIADLGSGDLSRRVAIRSSDKIGKLASAFNKMADLLLASNQARQRADAMQAQLAALVLSSVDAIMSKTADGIVTSWNPAAEAMFGYSEREMIGQPMALLIPPDRSEEESQILSKIHNGEVVMHFETVRRRKNGQLFNVSITISPIRDSAGTITGASKIARDITDQRRRDTLLRVVMETAPVLIYAKDRQGRMTMANTLALNLIGKHWIEVEGHADIEFLESREQAESIAANDQRIMETGESEVVEELVGNGSNRTRVFSSIKAPIRDGSNTVIGLIGISIDITERKRAEDRLQLMVNELNHRVKNTLTTVQAIASQSLRDADPSIFEKLNGRLIALAAAHDVLTREAWEGANLDDVVFGALAPFGGKNGGRFTIRGASLRIKPHAALALAMALHELCTNALKYGALSTQRGLVEIDWEVSKDVEPLFRLTWAERSGPEIANPSTRGFGIRMIERSLAQNLGGAAEVSFANPDGVIAVVEVIFAEIMASAEVTPLLRVGTNVG